MIKFIKRHIHINLVLFDQVIVSGANFLTGVLIARFLGIESFGVFTIVWMVIQFMNSIQMALISSPMMSIGPKQKSEDKSRYYGAVILQQIIFSTSSSLFVWVGIDFSNLINPGWKVSHLGLPLAITLFFFQNQDFLRRLFFTEKRALSALIIDSISYLGRIILLILLASNALLTITSTLWIIAITSAIAVIIGLCQIEKVSFHKSLLIPVFQRHWVMSKWLTASAVLQWTSSNYFIIAAASVMGPIAVGALKAAQNVIGITHILFRGLENIIPIAASQHFIKNSVNGLNRYLIRASIYGGGITILLTSAISIYPDAVLNILYGEQYSGYGYLLRWYSISYVLIFLALPLRSGLRALEISRPIFTAYLITTLFSITFAGPIVKEWGLIGVMAGILFTHIIMAIYLIYSYKAYTRKVVLA